MTCCYFSIREFCGIWKEPRAAELFKKFEAARGITARSKQRSALFRTTRFQLRQRGQHVLQRRQVDLADQRHADAQQFAFLDFEAGLQASLLDLAQHGVLLLRHGEAVAHQLVAVFMLGVGRFFGRLGGGFHGGGFGGRFGGGGFGGCRLGCDRFCGGRFRGGFRCGLGGWLGGRFSGRFRISLGGRSGGFGGWFCSDGFGGGWLAGGLRGDWFRGDRLGFDGRRFRRGGRFCGGFFRRRLDVGNRQHGGRTVGASWCRYCFDWG